MRPVFLLSLLLLSLSLVTVPVCSTFLNLHLKLDPQSESVAIGIDDSLHPSLPHDIIDFHVTHQPHITLYLTDFGNNTDAVLATLEELAPELKRVRVPLGGYDVNGTYAFWKVQNTPELQKISDLVVNATRQFIAPNQPIPGWVLSLPEPLRSIKIHYIQQYGSPNVFDQFVPHITILYDDADPHTNVVTAVNGLQPEERFAKLCILGVGSVGQAGTVLRGKDYGTVELKGRKRNNRGGPHPKSPKGTAAGFPKQGIRTPRTAPKVNHN